MSQTPSPFVSQYPFQNVEGNLFPPVCLKTHWDPTQMLRHILPQQRVALPEEFRPWVKVCKQYVTSAPAIAAPLPPKDMVFPTGGSVYPPGRYSAAIDQESSLRALDQPLDTWCTTSQYIPKPSSNMYVSGSTLPDRKAVSNAFVDELAMPQALLRTDGYTCRTSNDTAYFARSGRLFNNPTKQDRYGAEKYYALPQGLPQGQPMPHGGVPSVTPTVQATKGRGPFVQPGGALPANHPIAQNEAAKKAHYLRTVTQDDTSVLGIATSGSAARVW
jgi:hypothetical protein